MSSTVFIEVVDKKFLLCINLVNQLVLPPVGAVDFSPDSLFVRNAFADFLHARIPNSTTHAYAKACDQASAEATRLAYEALSSWLTFDPSENEVAYALRHAVAESRKKFEHAVGSAAGSQFGLPVPDLSKRGKKFWMLPNLSSFTNIYARINRFHRRAIGGVTLVHDEQTQFDHILEAGKIATENLADCEAHVSLAHADYEFDEHATLVFRPSHECFGIQVADVPAGFVMRFVQDQLKGGPRAMPEHAEALRFLLTLLNRDGTGINFVLATADADRLDIRYMPSYLPADAISGNHN